MSPSARRSGCRRSDGGFVIKTAMAVFCAAALGTVGPDLSALFPEEIRNSANVRVQCFDGGNEVAETGAGLALPSTFGVEPGGNNTATFSVNPSGCRDDL